MCTGAWLKHVFDPELEWLNMTSILKAFEYQHVYIYICEVYMISIDIVLINIIIDNLYDILVRFCFYGLFLKAPYEGNTLLCKKFAKLQQTKTDCLCTNGHLCTLSRGLAWACAIGFGASASGCFDQYLQRMAWKPSLGGRCWVCFSGCRWMKTENKGKCDWWGSTLILNQ